MGVTDRHEVDIGAIFADGTLIDEAIKRGVREALLRHKKLGQSIVIWRDGKVVWIPPEEIEVDDEDDVGESSGGV